MPNYYQCVCEEELRVKGHFAAVRIQSFLRGAAARGGVAALREKYLRIRATGKFQAAFRGLRGRMRYKKIVGLVRKINLSTTLSRVWRGAAVRREIARQKRCVLVRTCVRACACVRVRACVRACIGWACMSSSSSSSSS